MQSIQKTGSMQDWEQSRKWYRYVSTKKKSGDQGLCVLEQPCTFEEALKKAQSERKLIDGIDKKRKKI